MYRTAQTLLGLLALLAVRPVVAADADPAVRKAVSFYASFDEQVAGDFGDGGRTLSTRTNHPTEKGQFVFEKGFDPKVFRIAKGKGVSGGALEVVDVLKNNGRVYFPVGGNLAYRKGGWGGAVSVWVNTDPNTQLKTGFCDPIQITQKGANNGGIWFDFNDAKPRDLRMGAFPALAEGQKPVAESDPNAPMVRVPGVGFKVGQWHNVVVTWNNFDTGKPNAVAVLYIDGKRIGEVAGRDIAMNWDVDKAGVYVGVNYIGLLDELALFNRMLTAEEVALLHMKPDLLTGLKSPPKEEQQVEGKLRVLTLDGQNNHAWRTTTPYVKKALEDSGRFRVDVSSFLKEGDKPGEVPTVPFPPDLGKYDVVLSNYNGQPWPEDFRKALDEAVQSGKVGLVVFHAADNSFPGWPEFNRMIGMGWRNNGFGDRLYVDAEGKLVRVPKGMGQGAGETSSHPFLVTVRDREHPITKGMLPEWMHTSDQLVHGLRGPAEGVQVLATAYSDKGKKGTGEHELMMWTVSYGKGRVFHTPMGHDLTALRCVGLTTTLLRGTEWAATGKVTLAIPGNFPTAKETSSVPAK
jgi:hypothetical protein